MEMPSLLGFQKVSCPVRGNSLLDPATSGMTLAAPPLLSLFLISQRSNRPLVKQSAGFKLLGVRKGEGACSAGLQRTDKQFWISHWQEKKCLWEISCILANVSTLFLIPISSTAHFRSGLWLLYSNSMFNDLFSWNAQGIPQKNKYFTDSVEPAVSLLVWKYTCYL